MEGQRRLGRLARADQVSVIEASNLRDLIRQQDDGRESLAGLTLAAVLGCEDMRKAPTRTLMDIIKDEESGAAYRGLSLPNQHQSHHREKRWRSFKGRIRLRRAGVTLSSSSNPVNGEDYNLEISPPIPVPSALRIPQLSDLIPVDLPQSTRNVRENESIGVGSGNSQNAENLHPLTHVPARTTTIRLSAALEAEREEQRSAAAREIENEATVEEEEETVTPHPEAPRMSLMALLEETDRDAGMRYGMEEGYEEEVGEEEGEMECGGDGDGDGEEREGGGTEYVCCVCMVRHKGAAFIPCGHTFCRLCSRELWVSRGNCPLCNAYILEILDIF